MLRQTVRRLTESEIEPQASDFDERAELNRSLLVRCAELGLLGLTVPEADGGAGMDATAAVIAQFQAVELSAS